MRGPRPNEGLDVIQNAHEDARGSEPPRSDSSDSVTSWISSLAREGPPPRDYDDEASDLDTGYGIYSDDYAWEDEIFRSHFEEDAHSTAAQQQTQDMRPLEPHATWAQHYQEFNAELLPLPDVCPALEVPGHTRMAVQFTLNPKTDLPHTPKLDAVQFLDSESSDAETQTSGSRSGSFYRPANTGPYMYAYTSSPLLSSPIRDDDSHSSSMSISRMNIIASPGAPSRLAVLRKWFNSKLLSQSRLSPIRSSRVSYTPGPSGDDRSNISGRMSSPSAVSLSPEGDPGRAFDRPSRSAATSTISLMLGQQHTDTPKLVEKWTLAKVSKHVAEGDSRNQKIHKGFLDRLPSLLRSNTQRNTFTSRLRKVADLDQQVKLWAHEMQTILSSKDSISEVMELTGDDAKLFINILDYTLASIETSSRQHQTAFHCLRRLCIIHAYLPESFTLSSEALQLSQKQPEASGAFADIWRGRYDGRGVAFKAIRTLAKSDLQNMMKTFCKEAVIWKHLKHPNIAPFLGINMTHFRFCMVSAWMPNGNVNTLLSDNPDVHRPGLILDIAEGLHYLHSYGVIHGDLKGPNILVNETGRACLADFGLSTIIYSCNTLNIPSVASVAMGSIRWMAPEILDPEMAGLDRGMALFESDVYSFAMVMWEIFTGSVPFVEYTRDAAVMNQILRGTRPRRFMEAIGRGLTDEIWELMEECWHWDWPYRPMMLPTIARLKRGFTSF